MLQTVSKAAMVNSFNWFIEGIIGGFIFSWRGVKKRETLIKSKLPQFPMQVKPFQVIGYAADKHATQGTIYHPMVVAMA